MDASSTRRERGAATAARGPSPRHRAVRCSRGAARTAVLVAGGVLVAAVATWLAWDDAPTVSIDARRDLLAEAHRVAFLEGFDGRTEFEVWNAVGGLNPDRDEIAVLMPRRGRLVWRVDARPGARFMTAIARRQLGPASDDTPGTVTVRAYAEAADARGGRDADVRATGGDVIGSDLEALDPLSLEPAGAPVMSIDAPIPTIGEHPGAGSGTLRESTSRPLELVLSDGAALLEIVVSADEGVPDGSVALLLSPRVLQPPRQVPLDELAVLADRGERLLHRVEKDARLVDFALRVDGRGGETMVKLPPVEAVGAFTAQHARPALALLARPTARPEMVVDIRPDTVLRGAVALDDRMPSGTSVDLHVLVNGKLAAVETIDSISWREIAVPLGSWPGERVLELRLENSRLEPDLVPREDLDFDIGDRVRVFYRARVVRAGLANPRLERLEAVPRRAAGDARPSIVLLHVETLRADVLPMYGGDVADLTPRLDAIAGRSVVWERAFAPSPWTLPSTVTLFTGLTPSAHGAVDHDRVAMPGDAATLAERMRRAGLATGAVAANDLLLPRKGFGWGFDEYALVPYANARQVNELARAFLADHAGQQFFLFLHYFDPHHPYNAPGEFRARYVEPELAGRDVAAVPARLNERLMRGESLDPGDPDVRLLYQRYLGEVAWLDAQIGALLDAIEALGIADTTVVVLTSDHGEEFGEHGLYGHGSQLYDESLHVPLLAFAPGGQLGAPRRVEEVVSTAALYDTLLAIAGVEHDMPVFAGSLLEPTGAAPFAFAETSKGIVLSGGGDPLRRWISGVRGSQHLLVVRHPAEGADESETSFYDLRVDPGAQRPLPADGPDANRLGEAHRRSLEWSAEHAAGRLGAGGDEALLEALHELGYTQGGDGAHADGKR